MSKFKVGDKVMFQAYANNIEYWQTETDLDLRQPQIIAAVHHCNVLLEGADRDYWDEDYYESLEDWAEHQKAYSQSETLSSEAPAQRKVEK